MKIKINKYNISNEYKKRIILISDIHYYKKENLKVLNEVLDNIKKLNPDYICIAGDIIDDNNIKDKELLVEWFKKLSKVSKVLIGLGNHDFNYNGKMTKKYDTCLFKKIDNIKNIYVLDSKIYTDSRINFIGATLPYEYYDLKEDEDELVYYMNKKFNKLDNNFNIMLVHSPAVIANRKVMKKLKCHKNLDLVLCGHMHGGLNFEFMNKILKGRGLISPKSQLFGKYCNGIYNIDNTKVIISTGITKLAKSHKIALLNNIYSSEIVVIGI